MASYLLIESRDPFENRDVERTFETAQDLARAGHAVTLLLVENGVFAARESARSAALLALSKGVKTLADEFAMRERGIGAQQLAPGVAASSLEPVIDQLAAGHKVLWH